jgi:hypothetical protein
MTYANAHHFSMLAWSWNGKPGACSEGPLLIENYEGAPHPTDPRSESFSSRTAWRRDSVASVKVVLPQLAANRLLNLCAMWREMPPVR